MEQHSKPSTMPTGRAGEKQAFDKLTAAGYALVDHNVVVGGVEVDIIAQYNNRVVMVEVKTRREDTLDPFYGIDRQKLLRLARAGATYVKSKKMPHEVQIDVLLITNHADGTVSCDHIPDVCMPPLRHHRR